MKNEINELIDETINNHSLIKINDKLYLKKYQMDVLDYYHISYKNCSSVSELLFLINEVLESEGSEANILEEIAQSLQEFQYYNNTNK